MRRVIHGSEGGADTHRSISRALSMSHFRSCLVARISLREVNRCVFREPVATCETWTGVVD